MRVPANSVPAAAGTQMEQASCYMIRYTACANVYCYIFTFILPRTALPLVEMYGARGNLIAGSQASNKKAYIKSDKSEGIFHVLVK
jgi:hypothetical protein